ncbi:MAG: sulfurtransferase [Gammaproteobacteria bacterium]|nr:sulfurtransferase [Gammaproteobacteria bacterium]MDE2345445.1 sulfurtransferase [Gammaproteobacteria bacterium]
MPVRSLTPREVAELQTRSPQSVTILDVREPWEVERVRLPDSLHIPMDELREHLGELNPEQTYVVLCHHGNRSQQVAAFMQAQGFRDVINLAGGIEDWAASLDPGMARY